MNKEIKEIKFIKEKRKLYMIITYNDKIKYKKKLNKKDKNDLFYCLTNIMIINKYKR